MFSRKPLLDVEAIEESIKLTTLKMLQKKRWIISTTIQTRDDSSLQREYLIGKRYHIDLFDEGKFKQR